MPKFILIESSTALCSTALAIDGRIVESRSSSAPKAHASLTAPFIKEMLDAQGLRLSGCDAVCVSCGPGSYTGLRVGVSTAKGLCFASGLPLIAVSTTELLAYQAIESGLLPQGCTSIVPMIDARRMEVYTAIYNAKAEPLSEIRAEVVEQGAFSAQLSEGPTLFVGDGAAKCESALHHPNSHFAQVYPEAKSLLTPAQREFEAGHFRDIAYFEPFYLKQFTATVSKKSLF